MVFTGRVSLFLSGFAVDSSGLLYVGKDHCIEVYRDNEIVKKIDPLTSRAYAFTILKDDTILLSNCTTAYILDLNGNIINTPDYSAGTVYTSLQYNTKFTDVYGNVYALKNNWIGRAKIVCNNKTIYKMTMSDYLVKNIIILAYGSLSIFVPLFIIKYRLNPKNAKTI